MMMIFNELRKHERLAAKRHPMYEKNKYGKALMYVGAIFWAGYLIIIGTMLALAFSEVSNREPYHVMNGVVLILVLALDFLLRFPFQTTPTQEVKPYLLLPVKRNRLIDFLLVRSGLNAFNLLWLFLFFPFAVITIPKYFGVWGVITYCVGIWLVMILNNYWYLLCRTLLRERIWWILLPVALYGGLAGWMYTLQEECPLFKFFIYVGDGFIEGNILCFLSTIALIALLWLINRKIMSGLIYNELNKVEDMKVKRISEYSFFEKYGEIGEYMRLEFKMLLRNKRCKSNLRSIFLIVILFSGVYSFTSIYDGGVMTPFILYYAFIAFGMIMLMQLMGFEGNYIDGLMSRKESIISLLKAKYYVYCGVEILPLILLIPAIVMDKLTIFGAISWATFAVGPVYFVLFQMAVYNKTTIPLNEGIAGRQSSNNMIQIIIQLAIFIVPLTSYSLLKQLSGELTAHITFFVIGLGFILTSPLWIKRVYLRFMKRRYENMESFRNSR